MSANKDLKDPPSASYTDEDLARIARIKCKTCELPSGGKASQECDYCNHWKLSTRRIPEDYWACEDCYPESQRLIDKENETGIVYVTYMVYFHKDGGQQQMGMTLIVPKGENARNRAIRQLLVHINEWNAIALGERTYWTNEQFAEWVYELEEDEDEEFDEDDEDEGEGDGLDNGEDATDYTGDEYDIEDEEGEEK